MENMGNSTLGSLPERNEHMFTQGQVQPFTTDKRETNSPSINERTQTKCVNISNEQHKRRLLCPRRTGAGSLSLRLQDPVGRRCNAQERQIRGYGKRDSGCQPLREDRLLGVGHRDKELNIKFGGMFMQLYTFTRK